MKHGVTRPHVGVQEAEADRAAAVTVINTIDHWRQFLAPLVGGIEEMRLVLIGGNEIEQHDPDAERLIARHPPPKLVEAIEQKAGVAGLVEPHLIPMAGKQRGRVTRLLG